KSPPIASKATRIAPPSAFSLHRPAAGYEWSRRKNDGGMPESGTCSPSPHPGDRGPPAPSAAKDQANLIVGGAAKACQAARFLSASGLGDSLRPGAVGGVLHGRRRGRVVE